MRQHRRSCRRFRRTKENTAEEEIEFLSDMKDKAMIQENR